ncbi:hypothetical protein ACQUK4_13300, partial [Ralstonia pseudosolanacearum]
MKTLVPGGIVRALVALGLVSYQAVPALATGKAGMTDTRLQWVTQLIVKDGVQNSFRRTESSKRSGCVTDDAKPDANGTLRAAW